MPQESQMYLGSQISETSGTPPETSETLEAFETSETPSSM